MSLGYHISAEQGLITVRGHGEATLSDLTGLGRALLADPDYDPELPQLLDFRGLEPQSEGDAATDDLQWFICGPYRKAVSGSVAVVIDETLELRHAADIFLLTCAIPEAELFSSYDQALRWLMRQAFVPAPAPSSQQKQAGRDRRDRAPE